MMERFDKLLPSLLWEAAAAASGLLLVFYPAPAGYILVKAAASLGLFYALFRLLLSLRLGPGLPGWVRSLAASAAGLLLGLLFFFRPPLFWGFIFLLLGVTLVLYGLMRIPMIWENWSLGLSGRLAALAWAVLPILAGVLLLSNLLTAAAVLLRIAGLLLLLLALGCFVSDISHPGRNF